MIDEVKLKYRINEENNTKELLCPICNGMLLTINCEIPAVFCTGECRHFYVKNYALYGIENSEKIEENYKKDKEYAIYEYFDGAELYLILPSLDYLIETLIEVLYGEFTIAYMIIYDDDENEVEIDITTVNSKDETDSRTIFVNFLIKLLSRIREEVM